jgi:hypothetical protein
VQLTDYTKFGWKCLAKSQRTSVVPDTVSFSHNSVRGVTVQLVQGFLSWENCHVVYNAFVISGVSGRYSMVHIRAVYTLSQLGCVYKYPSFSGSCLMCHKRNKEPSHVVQERTLKILPARNFPAYDQTDLHWLPARSSLRLTNGRRRIECDE